ncbi:hypothetical protein TTHERM_00446410 (macronuclear) [Tetrahymena thermophila SB210]|uniref:Kinase domain protein n=1 Tax=Tetrahymena thermophila (strain SB210) TaxID=312017 RepID=I7M3H5_TETTS|nr:hypothetical protein TTHERM_00446410 [Tetrahymena thermophila SB210]EAS03159.2 hypothetical protein TTHERM_00446410 [Tetrahymena thermophila SB210]|eukprot:XP_001023404.2 hypothetical protein TTHERM_00446410 [Tetrahymena thermophila SB210]
MICVDFKAPRQNQLREVENQAQDNIEYQKMSFQELFAAIIDKLAKLSNQSEYLDVLIEVQNRLDQDAQKFEFSSKISQLKSCMKKSKELNDYLQKNSENKALVLKKIQDNFEIIENDNEICLIEELEIRRKMNRKYEKLIEKHLQQAKIAKQILSQVETDSYFQEILDKSGKASIDLSNQKLLQQFNSKKFELDEYSYCNDQQLQTQAQIKALGAGIAKNQQLEELSLNLFGTGINSGRLQALSNGLAKNKKLKTLDLNLGGNLINQQDVQILNTFLLQNSTLENLQLNLNYNIILGGGLKDLGYAFQKNVNLKSIKLEILENDVSKRGQKLYDQFVKKRSGISANIKQGIECKQYEIFKDFHQKRISSIQEIIAKQKLQIKCDCLYSLN